ncbi:rRNA maturation RNase YbeY [Aliiroseovarius lamellibrachiae]|uniref:rRNA maturation RNase YbeY n=1 Tax=Aliiroseovarius lamellibrachiae TaxID=1924933 RepID=UPI001BDF93B5|nr:rRNA maturation RNase YbeY [Aliiroseovarius lamellibrachiae]MBT2130380.1 rRNA maturation RNase YbeY [Aliiroseovarius lamellibrachiae]
MSVDIVFEDARWEEVGFEALAEAASRAVLSHLGVDPDAEIAFLACDDTRIAELNAEFRAKGQATNVLSWPSDERAAETAGAHPDAPRPDFPDAPLELGDIAIAYDTCAREAVDQSKDFSTHVTHLLVHGTLHLLGYDHIDEKDATLMEGLEVEILGKMGISNPYLR